MELLRKGGVRSEGVPAKVAEHERSIWVCDMHPDHVYEKPGVCERCDGMQLEERKILPGSKLVFTCPDHPEVVSEKPGVCPKDGKPLPYKVVSESTRSAETWACPMHPDRTGTGKAPCPDCGTEMKHYEAEQLLSIPFSAVIDTGFRKVVFVDRGRGVFDAVEVTLGPRGGEYYEVLKGLAAGDRVVTAGSFLLDAETRLNPAAGAAYFGAGGHEGHTK